MKAIIKKNKLAALISGIYVFLFAIKSDMAFTALGNSAYYLMEMAQILPVIFMLTVAIDVLVPKEWITRHLGGKSGLAGAGLALAFGSLSAGPIYGAFPIAKTLHRKGASVRNVVIILSAWAVIKVPMLANEAKFLGPSFMLARWFLTVIFIFAIGLIMEKVGLKIEGEDTDMLQAVVVKKDYCIGCTACTKTMPEVFAMQDGKAYVVNPKIKLEEMDEPSRKKLYSLVSKCPTKAIKVEE